jgi:hypothetical protein
MNSGSGGTLFTFADWVMENRRNMPKALQHCIIHLSVTVSKIPEIIDSYGGKDLLWLMVLKVSVHGHFGPVVAWYSMAGVCDTQEGAGVPIAPSKAYPP